QALLQPVRAPATQATLRAAEAPLSATGGTACLESGLCASSPGDPMPYMLLIMEPHGQRAERGLAGGQEAYARMQRFGDGLRARGVLRASESLASTEQAVRLQVREGQARLVDGPFAETKEMVGGFFLLDCATRDEALAIARECPAAEWATIEVRE